MRKRVATLLSVGVIGLAGCDIASLAPPDATPESLAPKATPQSEASQKMAVHLGRVQSNLLVNGLLRVDGGGPDVPFNERNLVDNFIRIALFDEYISTRGRIVARETESRLRRWEQPIRMKVEFGPSVPMAQRSKDRAKISAYVKRLSRLTGLPMRMTTGGDANFHVLILNEDERLTAGPQLTAIVPEIGAGSIRTITQMDRATLCAVFAFSKGANNPTYSKAIAIIRGEHKDLLRLACIHEELAQGLGLANDSPAARPSIFNDDEEFGLLTHHDELLLQMLYDRRLRPGMTAAQARPIIQKIANELLGGST